MVGQTTANTEIPVRGLSEPIVMDVPESSYLVSNHSSTLGRVAMCSLQDCSALGEAVVAAASR